MSGAVAPSTTAEWGSITGSIATQTDLVEYLNENIPIATTTTAGIVKATNSGSGSLATYVSTDGTLTAAMPYGTTAGLHVTNTTLYPHDGT